MRIKRLNGAKSRDMGNMHNGPLYQPYEMLLVCEFPNWVASFKDNGCWFRNSSPGVVVLAFTCSDSVYLYVSAANDSIWLHLTAGAQASSSQVSDHTQL